jgi:hypothetical protein
MGEEDGLRLLEVRVAGERVLGVALGELEERALRVAGEFIEAVDLVAQEEARSDGHLVVAAAAGVELVAGRADDLDQTRLDETVHVLGPSEFGTLDEPRLGGQPADLLEPARDLGGLGRREDPSPLQPTGVRRAGTQIRVEQATVETETGVVRGEVPVDLPAEAPAPQFHAREINYPFLMTCVRMSLMIRSDSGCALVPGLRR